VFYRLAALGCVMLWGCTEQPEWKPATLGLAHRPKADAQPKDFWMNGLGIKHIDGDQVRFEMTARKVIHCHRVTPLIHYENFDELRVESLNVLMPMAGDPGTGRSQTARSTPEHHATPFPSQKVKRRAGAGRITGSQVTGTASQPRRAPVSIRLPLQYLAGEFRGLNHSWVSREPGPDRATRGHDVLSRVLIDRIDMTLLTPMGPPITLHAGTAKLGTGFSVIQFEGAIVLEGKTCHITAPVMLGSSRHEELMFPAGLRKNGRIFRKATYMTLREDGSCHESRSKPGIHYHDVIEEQEASLVAAITKSMPFWAAFLLGPGLSALTPPK